VQPALLDEQVEMSQQRRRDEEEGIEM